MRSVILSVVFALLAGIASADANALAAVNAERSSKGRAPLAYDNRLEAAAAAHARDMATRGFLSHTGSDGSNLGKRMKRAGYSYCFGAENIAVGQPNLERVIAAWMKSSGHRKNMLNRKANAMGFARSKGNRWVLVLGSQC